MTLAGLLCLTAASAEPEVALPTYAVGDAFVFSNGRVEQVRAVNGETIAWAGLTGDSYERSANFIVPIGHWNFAGGSGTRTTYDHPDALWPLRAGRRARFRVVTETTQTHGKSGRSSGLWTCGVGVLRTVSVKAGVFEALPVTCDRYSVNSMRLVERQTWDYAPDVNHYVRRNWIDYYSGDVENIELVAALHGTAASSERLRALVRQAIEKHR